MKTTLLSMILVLFSTIMIAQNSYQDVVYLKNGSIIRGTIVEQVPNKSLKIETADKSVFVYEMDEVERIRKENISDNSRGKTSGIKDGYRGILEVGYGFGVGDYGLDRLKVNFINAHQINPFFSIGFGTGLHYYSEDVDAAVIPAFADLRANFLNRSNSPYIALAVGYSFDASENFEGLGMLFNPSVGVNFKIDRNLFMNVGIGYEMQKVEYEDYYGNSQSENTGAIGVNLGFSF